MHHNNAILYLDQTRTHVQVEKMLTVTHVG